MAVMNNYKLPKEIIQLSVSDVWESARLEWDFKYVYESEEPSTCLCGHYPIKNICVIKNRINSNETEVGNCCVNKFLDIDNGDKIIQSVKKIKKTIDSSMSEGTLLYLYDNDFITEWDYKFYSNIRLKRNLSDKQLNIKREINQKLINATKYETNSTKFSIEMVISWAKDNRSFNCDFVYSLREQIARGKTLSESQLSSLKNIIEGFNIEINNNEQTKNAQPE